MDIFELFFRHCPECTTFIPEELSVVLNHQPGLFKVRPKPSHRIDFVIVGFIRARRRPENGIPGALADQRRGKGCQIIIVVEDPFLGLSEKALEAAEELWVLLGVGVLKVDLGWG